MEEKEKLTTHLTGNLLQFSKIIVMMLKTFFFPVQGQQIVCATPRLASTMQKPQPCTSSWVGPSQWPTEQL